MCSKRKNKAPVRKPEMTADDLARISGGTVDINLKSKLEPPVDDPLDRSKEYAAE